MTINVTSRPTIPHDYQSDLERLTTLGDGPFSRWLQRAAKTHFVATKWPVCSDCDATLRGPRRKAWLTAAFGVGALAFVVIALIVGGQQTWLGIPMFGGLAALLYAPLHIVDPVEVTRAVASLDGTEVSILEPHENFVATLQGGRRPEGTARP